MVVGVYVFSTNSSCPHRSVSLSLRVTAICWLGDEALVRMQLVSEAMRNVAARTDARCIQLRPNSTERVRRPSAVRPQHAVALRASNHAPFFPSPYLVKLFFFADFF
jgi:hypothetical protein